MKPQSSYFVSVRLLYIPSLYQIGQARVNFTVPRAPFGGILRCNVTEGIALKTGIRCNATGWQTEGNSTRYQFYRTSTDGSEDMIGFVQAQNFFERTLPATRRITVRVID